MPQNLAFTLDVTNEGSSIFNDHISFNTIKVSYRLFKIPTFTLNITAYDWREYKDWKELQVTATLYDKWSFDFPITITGARIGDKSVSFSGLLCYKDNLLTKKSRFLGFDFKSAYKKLELYQEYKGEENVEVPEVATGPETPWGSGFFQLNCTDIDMILKLMKGISKDYFISMDWEELKLIKYSEGEYKDILASTTSTPSLLIDNLKYATEILSINPITKLELHSTEVQRDGYFRFKNGHHRNYELRGVSSYFFNSDFNDNINHNTKLEDGIEYSHAIRYSKYCESKLGDLISYPTGTNMSKLMIIGKDVELTKTSKVISDIELGVMTNEVE